jgi:hypothetical protein
VLAILAVTGGLADHGNRGLVATFSVLGACVAGVIVYRILKVARDAPEARITEHESSDRARPRSSDR